MLCVYGSLCMICFCIIIVCMRVFVFVKVCVCAYFVFAAHLCVCLRDPMISFLNICACVVEMLLNMWECHY